MLRMALLRDPSPNSGAFTFGGSITVVVDEAGDAAYRPASEGSARLVEGAEALYARSPDAVRRLIVGAIPNPLTAFADAFRLRKE